MDNQIHDNSIRAKLQQLLTTVRSQTNDDSSDIQAEDYNWNQPHCFDTGQLKKIKVFSEKIAALLTSKFDEFFNNNFKITTTSTTQHFASDFLSAEDPQQQSLYYLPMAYEQDQPCGVIAIPAKTALAWTAQLLGEENAPEDENKELSELEESLLIDIAIMFATAFSEAYDDENPRHGENLEKAVVPFELNGHEQLCKINFSIKKNQDTSESDDETKNASEVHFLFFCDKLEPIVQQNIRAEKQFSPQETSNKILEHLQHTPVTITAELGSVTLTFEELMELQVNDILLIDRKVDEPVELLIEGKSLFMGSPAKSAGKYAVAITQLSHDAPQNIKHN